MTVEIRRRGKETIEGQKADDIVSKSLGLMFRFYVPDDFGFIFDMDDKQKIPIHMLFVFHSLDVLWIQDNIVVEKKTLRPMIGYGVEEGDMVIEFKAGTASDISVGDRIEVGDSQ